MKRFRKLISWLLMAAFFFYVFRYFSENSQELNKISEVNLSDVLKIGFLYVLTLFVSGYFTKLILDNFEVNLSLKKYFHLTVVTTLFNMLMPMRAGSGIKAIYLKKQCRLNYSLFVSSLAGSYILNFLVIGLSGLMASCFLYFHVGVSDVITQIAFLTTVLGMLFLIVVPPSLLRPIVGFFPKQVASVLEGWNKLKKNKILLIKLCGLTFMNTLLGSGIMYYGLLAVNVECSLMELIYLTSVNGIISFINITPAGVGVVETMMIFVARNLEITTSDILLMSLVTRSATFAANFVLFPICLYALFGQSWKGQLETLTGKTIQSTE